MSAHRTDADPAPEGELPRVPESWRDHPGAARGVYLWAGTATTDLLRAKFPDRTVDVRAHQEAHAPEAADELAEAGLNVVFLSWSWGFPPELERTHHQEFRRAAAAYHARDFTVFAYVQASNCLAVGSHEDRDWYAVRPDGRTVPYFRRRRMTCWNHPGWVARVEDRIRGAFAAGADGVYLDNVWMGATPWILGGRAGGFAGCACERCRRRFAEERGGRIPETLEDDEASARYLDWRADVVRDRLEGWAAVAVEESPAALFVVNSCDVLLRDTRSLFGLDPGETAPVQSAVLVENVALPRREDEGVLVNNALTLRSLRVVAPDRPILALPYEHGIGLDGPPPRARLRRAVAEASSLGCSFVLKGSEYLDGDGRFTVVTSGEGAAVRRSVEGLLRWVADREELFRETQPAAPVGVWLDPEGLRRRWHRVAPPTFAVGQALLRGSVPWRFVGPDGLEDLDDDLRVLVVPPGLVPPEPPEGLSLLQLEDGLPDVPAGPGRLAEDGMPRRLVGRFLDGFSRAYFGSARVRRAVDEAGLSRRFLRSPFFRVPERSADLVRRLPPGSRRGLTTDVPVLVEPRRRSDGARITHLVSYGAGPVAVRIALDGRRPPRLHTPDEETGMTVVGAHLSLAVESWAVLAWDDPDPTPRTSPADRP